MDLSEPIRLIIWDLDETFWKGTLSEGGIEAFIAENHELVPALARRGIMSSICSKNDAETVRAVLEQHGLWEYFIFPSIDWTPKGARVAAMVEAIGLRPPTVMFIDDNPNNRGEVAAVVPGIVVADETFIPQIADHEMFRGKDDSGLTRLTQYTLLEQKKRDEVAAPGSNIEFLRSCAIQVTIEHELDGHIDRVVELINRTNQLNFTKQRLPEDPEAARAALREELRFFGHQAGLVHVSDRYGDYGYVGFYLKTLDDGRDAGVLKHFCFSCRTIGMGIEQWTYQTLGRPSLQVVGEVLASVHDAAPVDWINQAGNGAGPARRLGHMAEIRLRGGCEVSALAHYFKVAGPVTVLETNFPTDIFVVKQDASTHLVNVLADDSARHAAWLRVECPAEALTSIFLAPTNGPTLLVLDTWGDLHMPRYRHKRLGLHAHVTVSGFMGWGDTHDGGDIAAWTDAALEAQADAEKLDPALRARLRAVVSELRRNWTFTGPIQEAGVKQNLHAIAAHIPPGATLALVLPSVMHADGTPNVRNGNYARWCREALGGRPEILLIDIDDSIRAPHERLEMGDHFDRIVFHRLAEDIMQRAAGLSEAASKSGRDGREPLHRTTSGARWAGQADLPADGRGAAANALLLQDGDAGVDVLPRPDALATAGSAPSRIASPTPWLDWEQGKAATPGSSRSLRTQGIEVAIEHDVKPHLDRVIELVTRTSQLNFTKKDLPSGPGEAAAALLKQIRNCNNQAGLVRVRDRDEDYGYVGFYLNTTMMHEHLAGELQHFCFSSRIMGMGVEQFVYQTLGMPWLWPVGDVLSDVKDAPPVDWIKLGGKSTQATRPAARFAEIRMRGGCEMTALAHYFRIAGDVTCLEVNFRHDLFLVRHDTLANLANLLTLDEEQLACLTRLELPPESLQSTFLAPTDGPTLLVADFWGDLHGPFYRHKSSGFIVHILALEYLDWTDTHVGGDIAAWTDAELDARANELNLDRPMRGRMAALVRELRTNYEFGGQVGREEVTSRLRTIADALPSDATLVLILPTASHRDGSRNERNVDYAAWCREAVAGRPNIWPVEIDVAINSLDEHAADMGDHFDRIVYARLAEQVLGGLDQHVAPAAAPVQQPPAARPSALDRGAPCQAPKKIRRSLNDIGLDQGTDKASNIHDFLRFYERRLAHLREQAFTLIEIGVLNGGSSRSWGEFFPNAEIVGLDIDPNCSDQKRGNVSIRIGDASDLGFLFSVVEEFGRPTVVVDDGSHRWDHQILALQTLFPLIEPGGFFIMEDLDTSFDAHLKNARFEGWSPISTFDYLTMLAMRVVAHNAFGDAKPHDLFTHNFHEQVGTVEFGRRTCVISKKTDWRTGPI